MLAAAGSATGPAARSRCSVSIGRASGMSGQSSRAGPMSTRTRPSGSASDGQVAGDGADDLDAAAGLARQQIDDAAGGVAAGPGLGAVGVADAHEGIGVGAWRWRLDGDELVAADAGAPVGDRRGAAGGQAERAGALVEHDEVVAAAVHLEEARHAEGICGDGAAAEGARRTKRSVARFTPASVRSQATLTANLAPHQLLRPIGGEVASLRAQFGQANSGSTPPAACVSRPRFFSRPFWRELTGR